MNEYTTAPFPTLLIYILSNNELNTQKLRQAYQNNGQHNVVVFPLWENLDMADRIGTANILILDTDNFPSPRLCIENQKEILAMLASRIMVICNSSFQVIQEWRRDSFAEVFTSVENLLERQFFAY